MFGEDFWGRVNLQQIGEFLRQGSELPEIEEGTPEERYRKHKKEIYDSICGFRDKIIAHDWGNCKEKDREVLTEGFWEDFINAGGSMLELYFDMGLQAGMFLSQDMQAKLPKDIEKKPDS
ncbi:MAG: hypothetical protein FWE14_08410 [Lachnospiraceae bacterium]|nr:hypothetical protein [Lachnospiraceae bacterium]